MTLCARPNLTTRWTAYCSALMAYNRDGHALGEMGTRWACYGNCRAIAAIAIQGDDHHVAAMTPAYLMLPSLQMQPFSQQYRSVRVAQQPLAHQPARETTA